MIVGSTVLLLALAWPAIAPGELDSLPLSSYPMFAHQRAAVNRFSVAVNVDADGVEHRLDAQQIAGTDQPMQAVMTIRQAISAGDADELCESIAARAERPGTVEIATVTLDAVDWFTGDEEPIERTVHAECAVGER